MSDKPEQPTQSSKPEPKPEPKPLKVPPPMLDKKERSVEFGESDK